MQDSYETRVPDRLGCDGTVDTKGLKPIEQSETVKHPVEELESHVSRIGRTEESCLNRLPSRTRVALFVRPQLIKWQLLSGPVSRYPSLEGLPPAHLRT